MLQDSLDAWCLADPLMECWIVLRNEVYHSPTHSLPHSLARWLICCFVHASPAPWLVALKEPMRFGIPCALCQPAVPQKA